MSYRDIARARTNSHERGRQEIDKPLFSNTDLVGTIAEGEFAKAYSFPFQGDVGSRGDEGYDVILPDGRTIDVKGTERVNGNLIVPAAERKPLKADIYVLAVVDTKEETASFIGWATRHEVKNAAVKDYGYKYGPAYFIHRSRLHPMSELFEKETP